MANFPCQMKLLVCCSFSLSFLEKAKLYVAGIKFWYENYQNTLNLTRLFDDDVKLDECIRFIVEEANYSSIGRNYAINQYLDFFEKETIVEDNYIKSLSDSESIPVR